MLGYDETFALALKGPKKKIAKDHPKSAMQRESLNEVEELEEVAPKKKGHKPRGKKITKKTKKDSATKNDGPSFSMPRFVVIPPPLLPPTTIEVINMACSHCLPTLMSIATNVFALGALYNNSSPTAGYGGIPVAYCSSFFNSTQSVQSYLLSYSPVSSLFLNIH